MKTKLRILSCAFTFLLACGNSEKQQVIVDQIETRILDNQITPDNSVEIQLLDLNDALLNFEIIKLDKGYATRVQPNTSVQILDNSTFGYPDALQKDDIIGEDNAWSESRNFVLGTSVGHGGLFEGSGPSYLGFRIKDNGEFKYGWVLLDNNAGNTLLLLKSYGINQTSGKSILAGQIE